MAIGSADAKINGWRPPHRLENESDIAPIRVRDGINDACDQESRASKGGRNSPELVVEQHRNDAPALTTASRPPEANSSLVLTESFSVVSRSLLPPSKADMRLCVRQCTSFIGQASC